MSSVLQRSAFGWGWLGGFFRKASASAATLISDSFTDTDTTAIASHTIAPTNTPSTSWTARTGTWTISGNKAVTTTASQGHSTCNPGVADCTLSVVAKSTTTASATHLADAGVVARWANTSNLWKISINQQADEFRIVEYAAATATTRAAASVAISASVEYTIVAVLSGTTIAATLDGANAISYASATLNQTATVHGILARESTDRIDDFKVTVP